MSRLNGGEGLDLYVKVLEKYVQFLPVRERLVCLLTIVPYLMQALIAPDRSEYRRYRR